MGNCSSGVPSNVVPIREYVVLLLGLDDSGKTTLLANLAGESTENSTPTIGFSSTKVLINRHHVTFYDLGGNSRVRDIWKNYYSEAYGAVFTVDSSASDRFGEARDTLQAIVEDSRMKGKPVLVLANKQDLGGTTSGDQLLQQLGLAEPAEDSPILPHMVKCIALKSANRGKIDPAIRQGMCWLLNQMKSQYETLYERVNMDVANQRQEEAQKRKERAERVRKMKEERERQKKLAGITDGDETDDANQPEINPFKPISQAVVETEAREKANKARNEEITRRLKSLEDIKEDAQNETGHSSSSGIGGDEPEVVAVSSGLGVEVMPAASSEVGAEPEGMAAISGGSRESIKIFSSKVDTESVGGADVDDACDDKTEAVTHSSSVTSGLSSSGESLTDVTPAGSTDSPDGSTLNLHTTVLICPDVSAKMKNRDSHKHMKRSTLLSRMKNRSKTFPLQHASASAMTLDPPKAPAALGPLRVTPSLTPSTSPTLSHRNLSPLPSKGNPSVSVSTSHTLSTVPSVTQTIDIKGLPDLPHPRPSLPPVLAMSEHHDFPGTILHTEENVRNLPLGGVMKLSLPPKPSPIQT